MKRVCVFCGSKNGSKPDYLGAARSLGRELASRDLTLVYGGADIGLMGCLANAVLEAGGEVFGVIPRRMVDREIAHQSLTRLWIVDTMHERKMKMAELADAFVAMPGGLGTLEEIFEAVTWTQLQIHRKPCGFLNTHGYYDSLLAFLNHAVDEGFVRHDHRSLLAVESDAGRLLDALRTQNRDLPDKWS